MNKRRALARRSPDVAYRDEGGFTLVEMLTVVVIIALLVGLLLPSIAMVRRYAKETAQHAQFAAIETALDAFKQDFGDWPGSYGFEPPPTNRNYPGAMKLAEALLGWDLRGFHPKTIWRRDGMGLDSLGNPFPVYSSADTNLRDRRGPYLDTATTPVFHIGITAAGKNDGLFNFNTQSAAGIDPCNYAICDVFGVRKITVTDPVSGAVIKTVTAGSPIIYYKANTSSKDITSLIFPPPDLRRFRNRIYDFVDNEWLLRLGKLTVSGAASVNHPLFYNFSGSPSFYESRFSYNPSDTGPNGFTFGGSGIGYGIRDPKFGNPWPYRPDSYILISAGMDGLYGTEDDIHNY